MPRARKIFNWIYKAKYYNNRNYNLDFIETANVGIDKKALKAREEKERRQIKSLKKLIKIKTLNEISTWLFSEHRAYSVGLKNWIVSKEVMKSY